MKYTILKLSGVILLLFILSCKKSNSHTVPNPIGKWEASKDVGGEYQGTTFNPGNGDIFEFSDNTFKKYLAG